MVKGKKIVVLAVGLLVLSCIPFYAKAQQVYAQNGVRLELEAGYAGNLFLQKNNGASADVNFGYRLKHKHFLFDVGVGGQYMFTAGPLADVATNTPAVDAEGVDYMGHHTWNQRSNRVQHVQIAVPVMLGGEWKKVNFLVGAKANASVWAVAQEQGLYTLTATYPRYIESFETMPRHGFVTDQPYYNPNQPVEKSIDIRVVAEVNYRVWANNKQNRACYIGVFAEYGVWHPKEWTPFVVGAKATFLLWLKGKDSCHCYEN